MFYVSIGMICDENRNIWMWKQVCEAFMVWGPISWKGTIGLNDIE